MPMKNLQNQNYSSLSYQVSWNLYRWTYINRPIDVSSWQITIISNFLFKCRYKLERYSVFSCCYEHRKTVDIHSAMKRFPWRMNWRLLWIPPFCVLRFCQTPTTGCSSVIEYSRNSIFFIKCLMLIFILYNNVWIWDIIQICKTFARIWQIFYLL